MKKIFSLIALLSVSAYIFGQQEKEELAIKKLLEKEGAAYRMGDKAQYISGWHLKPYNKVLVSTADGRTIEFDPKANFGPETKFEGSGGFSIHSNHQFAIQGNAAWVKHDEVSISKTGQRNFSKEIRLLEKVNKQWKLVGQSIHGYRVDEGKTDTISYIHTVDIQTGEIEILASEKAHYEAPNWHPDHYLILNKKGKLFTFDLKNKVFNLLPTGSAVHNNNDHGISPDKKWLAISNHDPKFESKKSYKSNVYLVPIAGGEPKRLTNDVPSYWHGWSPDGKTLAYCAERNNNYDIYTIPVAGGEEKRLTTTEGLDDGPDYSPDGKYIYFNSYRSGHMQIWRMLADGSNPEQLTFDENSNWFPHPSPDNQWIVYIAYVSDEKQQHLFGKQVKLRLMNLKTKQIKDLTPVFFGGQGTINVPSWSPDSKKVAFVSYSIKN